jgi:dolichol-phosphate mannosyltransferase
VAISQVTTQGRAPSVSWQAVRFGMIGLTGTAISFVLFTLLNQRLGWRVVIANPIAYGAGIFNNYFWNRVWTYRHVERRNVLHQGSQFALISLGGLVLHTGILGLATRLGVSAKRDFFVYCAAYGLATAVSYAWNFSVNHRVTFRERAPKSLQVLAHPHVPHPHLPHMHHEQDAAPVVSEGD